VGNGEGEQAGVCDLAGVEQTRYVDFLSVEQADFVWPELVAGTMEQTVERIGHRQNTARIVGETAISYHTQNTVFCDGTGGPGSVSVDREPFVCRLVMAVRISLASAYRLSSCTIHPMFFEWTGSARPLWI
jgi:hypothetical protein